VAVGYRCTRKTAAIVSCSPKFRWSSARRLSYANILLFRLVTHLPQTKHSTPACIRCNDILLANPHASYRVA